MIENGNKQLTNQNSGVFEGPYVDKMAHNSWTNWLNQSLAIIFIKKKPFSG